MNADNTGPELTPGSEISQDQTSSDIPKIQYNGILVPHDGTEKSDKALGHAIYLSKLSGAEIIILNVIEHVKNTDSSALIATSKVPDSANAKLEVTIYGGVKTMVEEKIRLCKQAGVKSQISYKIQTGKPPVDEIINVAQVMNVDLIIMASSKITSSIKVHGSTTRKVINSSNKPVLVIHEQK
ncbi:MAG TPA: universal stress protein [Nitrososphaeraceae archaeon]|jgi:nucleotide-binding universal stress UspA family protein|nr:universal stress protein [Nitrososphaeraceae archaeon]